MQPTYKEIVYIIPLKKRSETLTNKGFQRLKTLKNTLNGGEGQTSQPSQH